MVNRSKKNNPSFWKIWRDSGAVGDIYETDRMEGIHNYRRQQTLLGNLTKPEIRELERFEFHQCPESIDEQVRRYYLKLKSDSPDTATHMLADTAPILQQGIHNLSDVEVLSRQLYKYLVGFLIRYEGNSYTVRNNLFK